MGDNNENANDNENENQNRLNQQHHDRVVQQITSQVFDINFNTHVKTDKHYSTVVVNFREIDRMIAVADNELYTNIYFHRAYSRKFHNFYTSHLLRYYYHVLATVHTLKVMRNHGQLDNATRLFLRTFEEHYPATTLHIDCVFKAFLQTIQAGKPANERQFKEVVPICFIPSRAKPLTVQNRHLPPDELKFSQPDWIGYNIFFNRLCVNNDPVFTIYEYNLQHNHRNNNAIVRPNTTDGTRRTQQLNTSVGFSEATMDNWPANDQQNQSFRNVINAFYKGLNPPQIAQDASVTSLEGALGFDIDPDFFGRVRDALRMRIKFATETVTFDTVAINQSEHILTEIQYRAPEDIRAYEAFMTQDVTASDDMKALNGWEQIPKRGSVEAHARETFTRRQLVAALIAIHGGQGLRYIPYPDLMEFLREQGIGSLFTEVTGHFSEEHLSIQQQQVAMAFRTYAPPAYFSEWYNGYPAHPVRSHLDGPYFDETISPKLYVTDSVKTNQNMTHVMQNFVSHDKALKD